MHRLAGDVQRQVGAVDDATHEAQPVGKEIFWLTVDEHFAAIEAYTRFHTTKPKAFHILSWCVEEGVDFEGCIGVEVKPKARLVESLGLKFVEIFVFFLGDVALTLEPDRADGVELLAIHQYGELHEGGILFNDLFDTILLREVFILILERDYNASAATFALDLLDLVSARSIARPAVALTLGLPSAGVDLDRIGHHEDGVEADAELTNEIIITLTAFFECVEKGF